MSSVSFNDADASALAIPRFRFDDDLDVVAVKAIWPRGEQGSITAEEARRGDAWCRLEVDGAPAAQLR
jgi:hypothetical protein